MVVLDNARYTRDNDGGTIDVVVENVSTVGPSASLSGKIFSASGSTFHGGSNESVYVGSSEKDNPKDVKIAKAMALFQKGVELYNEAKYEEALEAFLDAQTLYPSPDFQYNIGSCHEQLEQYSSAVRAFKTYLRNKANIADEANVRARIRRLEKLSEIQGGSSPLGESPSHKTPSFLEPSESQRQEQNQLRGSSGSSSDPSLQRQAIPPQQRDGKGLVISGAVVAGVGAIGGFVASLVFGLRATEKSDAIDSLSNGNNDDQLTLADAKKIDQQGRNAETMQWVSAGVGAGLFVAGAAMLSFGLIRHQKNQRLTMGSSVTRQSAFIQLSGRF